MSYESDKEFQRCIMFVLEQECRKKKDGSLDDGYVNDPNDPGGETKYGISKRANPDLDIKNLTLDGALARYYRDYWPIAASLNFPLNVCVLDAAVNTGVKRAAKFLLQTKNWDEYLELRKAYYIGLFDGKFKNNPNKKVYLRSWFNRLSAVRKFIYVETEKTGRLY